MSQKKLKRLKKETCQKESVIEEKIYGIREIVKNNWKFLVLLCLGIVVLYFNSLNGAFVSDDYATIPQNPEIMSFKYGMSGWMGGLINWFLAVTFGINSPVSFHVVSLLLYLVVVLISFVLTEVIFKNNLVSKFSSIIFAVLPIHVEAVSWIAGRPYLLNALFVLLSLLVFVLFTQTEKKKYIYSFLVFVFLTFAAEMTRSTSLVLLGILYWVSFDSKLKKKVHLGKIILGFGMIFLLVLIVLWPKMVARVESVNSGINASESIFYNPFFQYPTAIPKYLQLILVPTDLTLYHTMYVVPVWINWLVFLGYISCLFWFWFKDKRIFFSLAFIFMAAAPSMAPVKISWLVAERYIFLGSLGAAMWLAFYLDKIWQKKKWLALGILFLIIPAYSFRVFLRNIDWRTNHNLWVNTCQVSPNSHNAWNNIGDDYDKLAMAEIDENKKMEIFYNAIKGFGQSFAIKPNYADAYHNQANILYKIGRLDLSRAAYETAISYNPALYQTYLTLVQMDLMENNKTELLKHLNKLQQLKQNDLQVVYITATAYAKIGMIEEARQLATMMYQQFPNIAEIKSLYDSLKE